MNTVQPVTIDKLIEQTRDAIGIQFAFAATGEPVSYHKPALDAILRDAFQKASQITPTPLAA